MTAARTSITAFQSAIALSDETCTVPPLLTNTEPLAHRHGIHLKDALITVSAISTGLCCIVAAFLILTHLTNFVRPAEQKQLVRVVLFLPVYAICGLFSTIYYDAAAYLVPIPRLYGSLAIVSLFYFYVNIVSPEKRVREQIYDSGHDKRSSTRIHLIWICVFQSFLGCVCSLIASEITTSNQCPFSSTLRRNLSIIRTVEGIQVLIAVVAVILYARMMRSPLQGHRPFAKLFTFKALVIIEAIQTIAFTFCSAHFIWHPTKHISYRDLQVGLPNTLICLEMLVATVPFMWSFSAAPYRRHATHFPSEQGQVGVLRGLVDVCNIMDMVWGLFWATSLLVPCRPKNGVAEKSRKETGDGEVVSSPPVKGAHTVE